ncbi:MAG TPA: hypothetical protein VIE65_12430 [Methylobacter sp.]|jgi:hypothetical protein
MESIKTYETATLQVLEILQDTIHNAEEIINKFKEDIEQRGVIHAIEWQGEEAIRYGYILNFCMKIAGLFIFENDEETRAKILEMIHDRSSRIKRDLLGDSALLPGYGPWAARSTSPMSNVVYSLKADGMRTEYNLYQEILKKFKKDDATHAVEEEQRMIQRAIRINLAAVEKLAEEQGKGMSKGARRSLVKVEGITPGNYRVSVKRQSATISYDVSVHPDLSACLTRDP